MDRNVAVDNKHTKVELEKKKKKKKKLCGFSRGCVYKIETDRQRQTEETDREGEREKVLGQGTLIFRFFYS